MLMVISQNSLFSLFAALQDYVAMFVQEHAFCSHFLACFSLPYSGVISESQPTVRGHTLTRCPLPGWRVAAAPSTPERPKP